MNFSWTSVLFLRRYQKFGLAKKFMFALQACHQSTSEAALLFLIFPFAAYFNNHLIQYIKAKIFFLLFLHFFFLFCEYSLFISLFLFENWMPETMTGGRRTVTSLPLPLLSLPALKLSICLPACLPRAPTSSSSQACKKLNVKWNINARNELFHSYFIGVGLHTTTTIKKFGHIEGTDGMENTNRQTKSASTKLVSSPCISGSSFEI